MELIKAGKKTYYIKNNTNIGIYLIDDKSVYLIDSGNDKDSGKKILKIIEEQGWLVKGIINTHSNADHCGGNKVIQERTNCIIFNNKIENDIVNHPILEPSFLYGGYPFKEIRNKFLLAQNSISKQINSLPEGLEYFEIKGHFFDMIGIKTCDDIYFLGDSLFSKETIDKYKIFFIYDVKEYLNTLEFLKTIKGKLFIPSHCEETTDINELIELNQNTIIEISNNIYEFLSIEKTFEEILKYIFDKYNLTMNSTQYVLIGSTIKSYLSFLNDSNKITFLFKDNKMYWIKVREEK